MTTYNNLKAYFDNLARNHAQILHSDAEKHFFHCDLNEILSGISSRVNFPAVMMADYDYSFVDNNSDNHLKKRSIALVFLDHAADVDDFQGIGDIYSNMEQIADDWINRMYDDKLERRHAFLKDFQINEITAVQFSTVDNNFGVWLPIIATTLHDIRIDTGKWTDL
jgi:hypothetical protein